MDSQFGPMLREWRETRRLSQLDLGLVSNVSARHISFLETGRARPSRDMVLHLSEFLGVPRGSRNALLGAAGFAPAYRAREFDEAEMAPIREALDWMLERHMPYPALVLDRRWTVVQANGSALAMLAAAGIGPGGNLLDFFAGDESRLKAVVENWRETGQHLVTRLRTEVTHLGGDAFLEDKIAKLEAICGRMSAADLPQTAVVATRYRMGEVVLSFFSTISQFGTTEDIALADWKIEHFFPADEETRAALAGLA